MIPRHRLLPLLAASLSMVRILPSPVRASESAAAAPSAPEPPAALAAEAPPPPALPPGACVLAHGGAGTPLSRTFAVLPAVAAAAAKLAEGGSALDAAVAGAIVLEDDPGFNAGTGSNIRMDGETVQMDAAVMDASGDFGAVAVIERVKNPVLAARAVFDSPHLVLAGEGATRFARSLGLADYDPRTTESLRRRENLLAAMRSGVLGEEWRDFDWRARWNFAKPLPEVLRPNDTIGVVVRDGKGGYAAAVSTGGTSITLLGRVGDVPILGAGIYCGPAGAVCATGWGEYIVRETLSRRVYDWMAGGLPPAEAVARGLALYPEEIGMGLIAVAPGGEAAASNMSMAWAGALPGRWLRADEAAQ